MDPSPFLLAGLVKLGQTCALPSVFLEDAPLLDTEVSSVGRTSSRREWNIRSIKEFCVCRAKRGRVKRNRPVIPILFGDTGVINSIQNPSTREELNE